MTVFGYAVVRRLNWTAVHPESVVARRTPAVALSRERIAIQYRGFDGEFWPGDDFDSVRKNEFGLVESTDVGELRSRLARVDPLATLDFIFVEVAELRVPLPALPGSVLGYDVGHFGSVFDKYSVLLNDVIFGAHDELRAFGGQLNEHLLLPSLETARFLRAAREDLLRHSADLETDVRWAAFRILDLRRMV